MFDCPWYCQSSRASRTSVATMILFATFHQGSSQNHDSKPSISRLPPRRRAQVTMIRLVTHARQAVPVQRTRSSVSSLERVRVRSYIDPASIIPRSQITARYVISKALQSQVVESKSGHEDAVLLPIECRPPRLHWSSARVASRADL